MDREAFLNRIAEQLGRPRLYHAPPRAVRGVSNAFAARVPTGTLAQAFARELEAVGGKAVLVRDSTALELALRQALAVHAGRPVVTWARGELAGFELGWLYAELGARAVGDPGFEDAATVRTTLFGAGVGVTAVDYAIASSGSLVLTAAPGRPRGVSLLPSLHVALVRETQIVRRPGGVFQSYDPAMPGHIEALPSLVQFITGPSRTSDIENDLTIGVHGPAAVLAIVLLEPASAGSTPP